MFRCICDELRDELAKQSAETTELITKLDRVSFLDQGEKKLLIILSVVFGLVCLNLVYLCKFSRKSFALSAQLDAAKYDATKFCIATVVSICAVACQIATLPIRVLACRSG